MDIALEPEIYCPSVDEQTNFVDKIPQIVAPGIRCPCGSRKDKVYETRAQFTAHVKTGVHQKWLSDLNLNKVNLYSDNLKKDEVIASQQKIIAEQSNKIAQLKHELHTTSQCLAIQLNKHTVHTDLILFD